MGFWRGHLDGVDHSAAGLLLKVFGAAVPELRFVEHGVENRRRVAPPTLPVVPNGGWFLVDAAKPDVVAGIAADGMAGGQPRLEVKHLAKFQLGRHRRISGKLGGCCGNRLELLPGLGDKIILRQNRRGGKAPETQNGSKPAPRHG